MSPTPSAISELPPEMVSRLSRRAHWLAVVPLIAALLIIIGLVTQWASLDIRAATFASSMGMRGNPLNLDAAAYPAAFLPMLARSVPVLIFAGTMIFLFTLFRRLSAGHILDVANAKLVSRAGIGFVVFAATAMISNTVITLLLSLHNPPGQQILTIGLTTSDIGAFAAGFALWGLGAVLVQAAGLADDHASIV